MTPPDLDQSNTPITQDVDRGGTNPQASQPDQNQTPPTAQPATTTPVAQPSETQQPSTTMQPSAQQPQTGMVSNPTPVDPNANHPAVRVASILNSVGQALAGGARTVTRVDPVTGETTRSVMPLSNKQIGLALAASALSGAFNGLAQKGPGASGAAAAAGFNNSFQQQQQAKAQQEAQAQADAESQSKAYARQAATFEANSRTILNTSQAEAHGADALDKLVEINRKSGILDVDSDSVDNGGIPVTQAELQQKIADGSVSFSDTLGPVAGRTEVTAPDGTKHWEATHLLLRSGDDKVTVSPEAWKMYSDAGVPGFSPKTSIGENGVQIKRSIVQNANEQVASKSLVEHRLTDLKTELAGTQFADQVPTSIDFTKPGVRKAMTAYQKYTSHNADNLSDPYAALQAMGADKRDPQTGQLQPNPDAKFVDQVATTLGGWPLLRAAHDQIAANTKSTEQFNVIDSADKAQAVLANPDQFTPKQATAAKNFIQSDVAHKAAIARAGAEAREAAKPQVASDLTGPDVFGNVPTVTDSKEASKRFAPFKKNLDSLNQTEQTYNQFQSIANDAQSGKLTGAASVVALLAAVGISAQPLKGNGFRISKDILNEHKDARGWEQSMQQKFLAAKDGDVITPKQILDYSNIAANARTSQYVNTYNQMRNAGISADAALPTGNGQKIDPNTARIFFTLAGGDANKAMAAAAAKGWSY